MRSPDGPLGPLGGPMWPPDWAVGLPGDVLSHVSAGLLTLAVVAVAVALVVGAAYALVGSVMEFVFVESLRRQRVLVRRYADQHLGQALRLFGFRALLWLVVVLPAVGIVLTAVSFVVGQPGVSVGVLAVLVPLLVVLGIAVASVDAFTTSFVVPVMIQTNLGVLAAWRRFWPTLTGNWEQYGIYVLVRVGLALAVGVLASIVGSVVGAVVVVPVAVVGVVLLPALGGPAALLSNPVALAIVALLVISYVVVLTAALSVAFVPIRTYLRYHALLVLGDTDSQLDLIPDLRREIRDQRE